jgi:acyl transferase domain-containing protein
LLRNGIDKFDNGFFEISSTEAAAMDPQHRLVLEVAYEAFESAGISIERLAGSNTAVFLGMSQYTKLLPVHFLLNSKRGVLRVRHTTKTSSLVIDIKSQNAQNELTKYTGVSGSDYATSLQRDIDTLPKYHSTGSSIAICANRISYQFDLRGPSMVIDTACSSSATAFHQAVLALKAEECSMALVSATNLILDPDSFVHMSNLGFLSPEGICHSFDSTADGYARGEGVLSVILKPLSQAIKDGDPIRSIIRGSSINQDGHTNGITLPSANRQKENMEMLYSRFAVDPDEIQYFEAHVGITKFPLQLFTKSMSRAPELQ